MFKHQEPICFPSLNQCHNNNNHFYPNIWSFTIQFICFSTRNPVDSPPTIIYFFASAIRNYYFLRDYFLFSIIICCWCIATKARRTRRKKNHIKRNTAWFVWASTEKKNLMWMLNKHLRKKKWTHKWMSKWNRLGKANKNIWHCINIDHRGVENTTSSRKKKNNNTNRTIEITCMVLN